MVVMHLRYKATQYILTRTIKKATESAAKASHRMHRTLARVNVDHHITRQHDQPTVFVTKVI